jgi:hypothetical protein
MEEERNVPILDVKKLLEVARCIVQVMVVEYGVNLKAAHELQLENYNSVALMVEVPRVSKLLLYMKAKKKNRYFILMLFQIQVLI